jgi:hypothetical protein
MGFLVKMFVLIITMKRLEILFKIYIHIKDDNHMT